MSNETGNEPKVVADFDTYSIQSITRLQRELLERRDGSYSRFMAETVFGMPESVGDNLGWGQWKHHSPDPVV